jgi:hypothetical protein
MITWVRTAKTLSGRFAEGAAWAKEVSTIVERIIGKKLVVCASFGGPSGEIAWIGQFDDGAQVEETYSKVTADRDYQAALTKAQTLFVPDSPHDQMWRHI